MGAFSARPDLRSGAIVRVFEDCIPFGLETGLIDDTRSTPRREGTKTADDRNIATGSACTKEKRRLRSVVRARPGARHGARQAVTASLQRVEQETADCSGSPGGWSPAGNGGFGDAGRRAGERLSCRARLSRRLEGNPTALQTGTQPHPRGGVPSTSR